MGSIPVHNAFGFHTRRFNTVYRLERVLFKAGALVDPVTGARSLGPVFELDAHRRLAASYAARYGHGRPSAVPAASEQVLPEGLRPEDVDAELEQWASDATDLWHFALVSALFILIVYSFESYIIK